MYHLEHSLIDEIEKTSYELSRQAMEHFNNYKAGRVYIPPSALRAMGRRYLKLRDRENLSMVDLCEFGRLYGFFCLMYPNGENFTVAGIAIDFCNLINATPPLVEIED